MKYFKWAVAIVLIAVMAFLWLERTGATEGFDFSNPLIPVDRIMSGGPGKDGIPAISNPEFTTADKAGSFLKETDRVMAVSINGDSRAYPVKIMNWHEIVIDKVGGLPLLVSFCPLCGTGMMFDRRVNGKEYTFGVSGLLYESDLLFYDHQTDSLWSQIEARAVTGKMSGSRLELVPSLNTTWGYWKDKHPDTKALTTNTGYSRDYNSNPYGGYGQTEGLMFPVTETDSRFKQKELVIGVKINDEAKAYLFSDLKKAKSPFTDQVGGETVMVHFDNQSLTAFITDKNGERKPAVVSFWFAWYAFNPGTKVYGHD